MDELVPYSMLELHCDKMTKTEAYFMFAAAVAPSTEESDISFIAAVLISAFSEENYVQPEAAALRSLETSKNIFPIASLQTLPDLLLHIPDDVFVARVISALNAYPCMHLVVTPDNQHIRRLTKAQQITHIIDSIFADEPPVPESERRVLQRLLSTAPSTPDRPLRLVRSKSSGAEGTLISELLAMSPTLRSVATTPQSVTEALYHCPPLFSQMSRDGKRLHTVNLDAALVRQLDLYFTDSRLKYDRHLTDHLAKHDGTFPIALLAGPTFSRIHRIISKYQPAVDPVHLLTTLLRRDMCKRIVLAVDGVHVKLADSAIQILRQLEYFFGDENYSKDTYLQSLAEEGEDNFVPLEKVCAFRSMQKLGATPPIIADVVAERGSAIVEISVDGESVRRLDTSFPAGKPFSSPANMGALAGLLGPLGPAPMDFDATVPLLPPQPLVPSAHTAGMLLQLMICDVFADNHLATDRSLASLLQDSTDELPPGFPCLCGAVCAVPAKKLLKYLRVLCATGYARNGLLERANSVFILPEEILLEGFLAVCGDDPAMRATLHEDVIYVQKLAPLPFFRRLVQNPRASRLDCAGSFSVMTYNVLADSLCSPAVYDYANPLSLNWTERRDRIMREIVQYDPGVIGLQEIQATVLHWGKATFRDNHAGWFREQLALLGFDGCLRVNEHDSRLGIKSNKWPRIGVALFWKTTLWEPLPSGVRRINYSSCMIKACAGDKSATRALSLWQGAVLTFMRHIPTGNLAVFATTHISCRWQEPFVQIMQMHMLVREIESMLGSELASTIPVFIFGDFNVSPTSGGYELYTKGKLAADHPHLRMASHPTEAGKKPVRLPFPAPSHTLSLRSAYAAVLGAEPTFTNYAQREMSIFSAALDYIFYTPTCVKPCAVLDTVPEAVAAEETALPNRRCPSDHLPLYAEFSFTSNNRDLEKALMSVLGPGSSHGDGVPSDEH